MQTISELENELEELPLLPTVIVRLLALDAKHENYFDKVLELSQEDPTFALRVMQLSNSAVSSPSSPITTLQDAVVRLGVNSVASLVTSMSAIRVFVPKKQGEKNLWVHSIQVAVCSRIIARIATELKVNPEQAYICGLMHDIGRFVLFDKASDELNLVQESNWESPEQLIITEKELYGFNHSELGSRVCKKWGLPQVIIDIVTNHHTYSLPDTPAKNEKIGNLIRIIQIADFFSAFMMINPDAITWKPEKLEKELDTKCIRASTSKPLITAKQLCGQAVNIIEESNKLTSGLGVD